MKKYRHLRIPEHWEHYWSKYPQGYTVMEALISWVSEVNQMVDSYNDLTDHADRFKEDVNTTTDGFRAELDEFLEQFDSELQSTVISILSDWQENGFLDIVIDEALQTQIDNVEEGLYHNTLAEGQTDYTDLFTLPDFHTVGLRKNTDTEIELFAQNDDEGVRYLLTKDTNDDFYKFGIGGFCQNHSTTTIATHGTGWVKDGGNWYTTQVGDSFSLEYEGSGIGLEHFADNRGGVWQIKLGAIVETLTTYTTQPGSLQETDFRHPYGKYRLTATFIGNEYPGQVETPRGWIRETATVYGSKDHHDHVDLLHPTSNKEFAFSARYNGGSSFWFPEHNNTGTMFNHTFSVHIEDEPYNFDRLAVGEVVTGEKISVQQFMDGVDPVSSTSLADFRIQHILDKTGKVQYKGRLSAKQAFTIETGYPLMLAVNSQALNRVVTSYGDSKLNAGDSTEYFFNRGGGMKSVVFTTNISGYGQYVAFASLTEPTKAMRYGQDGTPLPNENTFFWQRPTVPKFYFQSFDGKDLKTGDTYTWGGRIGVARSVQTSFYL